MISYFRIPVVAAIALAGCVAPFVSPGPDGCTRSNELDTTFVIAGADSLAGKFRLVLVNRIRNGWDTTRISRGTLELWPTDSARLQMLGGFRRPHTREFFPLDGAMHFDGANQQVEAWAGTVDRVHPHVELAGNHLMIGDVMMNDGSGWWLELNSAEPNAFRGTWRFETGIASTYDSATGRFLPDPQGWFCATRIP